MRTFASPKHGERDDHRAALSEHHLPAGAALLAAVTTATTFLPWGGSGERTRSSYELIDVADRAGVLEGSAADWAWLWFVVPVLCGAALVALALDRRLAVGILAGTLGVLTVIGGVMIARSPLVTQVGAWAGIVSGGVTALVSTATLKPWSRRRADD